MHPGQGSHATTDLTTPFDSDVPQRASRASTRFTIDQRTIAILRHIAKLLRAAQPAIRIKIQN